MTNGEIYMKWAEIAPAQVPAGITNPQPPTPQMQAKILPVDATRMKRGRLRQQLAVDIAQSNAKVDTNTPTNFDKAMAFTHAAQVQRAADNKMDMAMSKTRR